MNDNDLVCRHCGIRVLQWASAKAENGWVWKHASGGRGSLACSKPQPTTKAQWDDAMNYLFSR